MFIKVFSLCVLLMMLSSVSVLIEAQELREPEGEPWKLRVIDNSSEGADGVKLGDYNGDGRPDIATGWEEGGVVRIYVHPGKERVKDPWFKTQVGEAPDVEDAVWMDVNDDGRLDVVSSSEGETMRVHFHIAPKHGKGKWQTRVVDELQGASRYMFAWPAEIDGQSGMDLVVGSKDPNGMIGWLQHPSEEGGDWKWHKLVETTWIMSIWFEDIDGDGDEDMIYTDRRGDTRGIHWLEKPEDLTKAWTKHTAWTEKQEFNARKKNSNDIMSMAPCDIDGDGLTDYTVALQNYRILILRRVKADQPKWEAIEIPVDGKVGNTRAVQAGDLDGDGDLDLAVTTWMAKKKHGTFWMENDGTPLDGGWKMRTMSGAEKGIKYDRIELVDLDEDGDLDLLTCEEREGKKGLGVIWYENPSK